MDVRIPVTYTPGAILAVVIASNQTTAFCVNIKSVEIGAEDECKERNS